LCGRSAHGRRRPAPTYVRAATARDADGGIGNLGAILGFVGSLGAWAGGERHFGPDWRGSGAGVRIRMKFFGRYVFLSGPTDIHDISGVSAKFRRKCFPCPPPRADLGWTVFEIPSPLGPCQPWDQARAVQIGRCVAQAAILTSSSVLREAREPGGVLLEAGRRGGGA
jgi:hypothetical protein